MSEHEPGYAVSGFFVCLFLLVCSLFIIQLVSGTAGDFFDSYNSTDGTAIGSHTEGTNISYGSVTCDTGFCVIQDDAFFLVEAGEGTTSTSVKGTTTTGLTADNTSNVTWEVTVHQDNDTASVGNGCAVEPVNAAVTAGGSRINWYKGQVRAPLISSTVYDNFTENVTANYTMANIDFSSGTWALMINGTIVGSGIAFESGGIADIGAYLFPAHKEYVCNISFSQVQVNTLLDDLGPAVLTTSAYNVTSAVSTTNESIWVADHTAYVRVEDSTPTINFTVSESTNCSIGTVNTNFSNMTGDDSNRKCGTTDVLGHTCTVPSTDVISGEDLLYIACIGQGGTGENASATSPPLSINLSGVAPNMTAFLVRAVNSSLNELGGGAFFNSANLSEIEFMRVNSTVFDDTGIDTLTLHYTANGTRSCGAGNRRNSPCINDSTNAWVTFINATKTASFDGGVLNTGDNIDCSFTGSGSNKVFSCLINEFYNPNVAKHYAALFDFSVSKFQNETSQKITKNNFIKVKLPISIPVNADQYKLDFTANSTATAPVQALDAYVCNSTYSTGDPEVTASCKIVGAVKKIDFGGDSILYRAIFTKTTILGLGDLDSVVLKTDETELALNYLVVILLSGIIVLMLVVRGRTWVMGLRLILILIGLVVLRTRLRCSGSFIMIR